MRNNLLVLKEAAFTFDDVILIPQHSDISSRSIVDISTKILGIELKIPIISANMDTVTGPEMFDAMRRQGAYGFLHRFASSDIRLLWASLNYPVTIGAGKVEFAFAKDCIEKYGTSFFCIDIAHGDSAYVIDMIKKLRSLNSKLMICAGNIVTATAARRLITAGANVLKVGVGPGSVCTTRAVTGHGFPQLSAIMSVSDVRHDMVRHDVKIIADGGIKSSGDIVKALAAGADAVMLGGMLAGCAEAPGDTVMTSNGMQKVFRGMASKEAYCDNPNRTSKHIAPEGINSMVPLLGSVEDVAQELAAGLRSGLTYSGALNLKELRQNAIFQFVSAGTQSENSTRR